MINESSKGYFITAGVLAVSLLLAGYVYAGWFGQPSYDPPTILPIYGPLPPPHRGCDIGKAAPPEDTAPLPPDDALGGC